MFFFVCLVAGVPESKLVEAHGSFATATCRYCKATYPGHTIMVSTLLNLAIYWLDTQIIKLQTD